VKARLNLALSADTWNFVDVVFEVAFFSFSSVL
jgi:hypothetical protein